MTTTTTEVRPATGVRADELRTHIEPLKHCIQGVAKRLDTLPKRPTFYNATTPANPDELTLFAEPGVTADISINISEALERKALIADIIKVINDVHRKEFTRTLVIIPGSRKDVMNFCDPFSTLQHNAILEPHEVHGWWDEGVTNWRTLTTDKHLRDALLDSCISARSLEKNNVNVVVLDADRQYQAQGAQAFLKELGNYANVTLTVVTAKSGVTLSATNKFTVQVGTGTWLHNPTELAVELGELWDSGDYGKRVNFPQSPASRVGNVSPDALLRDAILRAAEGYVNPELLDTPIILFVCSSALVRGMRMEAEARGVDTPPTYLSEVCLANLDIVTELVRATVTSPEARVQEVEYTTQFLTRAA